MMKLYFNEDNEIREANIVVCKKPKMTCHRGRTWDCTTKEIDGVSVDFFLDTTWGFFFYFNIGEKWYKTCISHNVLKDGNYLRNISLLDDVDKFRTSK